MSVAYIMDKGARISKKGNQFIVIKDESIVSRIPVEILEGLVVVNSVQISSQAIVTLLQQNIPVSWISATGKYYGCLESPDHVNVEKHLQQMTMRDDEFSLKMAKRVILAKVHNQVTLLQRYNRRINSEKMGQQVQTILSLAKHIEIVNTREEIMGYEGIIAKNYFEALGAMVFPPFSFEKRSKRPPLDPFNALLSLGYTLVFREIYTAVISAGLHPYFGFLHSLKNHHPALVSDLQEEWRTAIVDSLVVSLIHRKGIRIEHFQTEEGERGVFLTHEGWKIFLQAYENRMRTHNAYVDGNCSYRQTLRNQAWDYSRALMAKNADLYHTLWIR